MSGAALPLEATPAARQRQYQEVRQRIHALLEGEDDWIAAMSTVACELHSSFDYFHWTGFYRAVGREMLIVGPYQGTHGCLRIPYSRGVCGAAARTQQTQRVADVDQFADHIACSATTRSEIVVPVVGPGSRLLAVLDVDSNHPDAFSDIDQNALEELCALLGQRFGTLELQRES